MQQQCAREQQLAESDYLRELRYEYVELSGVQVTHLPCECHLAKLNSESCVSYQILKFTYTTAHIFDEYVT